MAAGGAQQDACLFGSAFGHFDFRALLVDGELSEQLVAPSGFDFDGSGNAVRFFLETALQPSRTQTKKFSGASAIHPGRNHHHFHFVRASYFEKIIS